MVSFTLTDDEAGADEAVAAVVSASGETEKNAWTNPSFGLSDGVRGNRRGLLRMKPMLVLSGSVSTFSLDHMLRKFATEVIVGQRCVGGAAAAAVAVPAASETGPTIFHASEK